jgi:hypothetical protein
MSLVEEINKTIQQNVSALKEIFSEGAVQRYKSDPDTKKSYGVTMNCTIGYSQHNGKIDDYDKDLGHNFTEVKVEMEYSGKLLRCSGVQRHIVDHPARPVRIAETPQFGLELADRVFEESVWEYNRQMR